MQYTIAFSYVKIAFCTISALGIYGMVTVRKYYGYGK